MIELLCENINKDFDMVLNTSLTLILTGDALRHLYNLKNVKKAHGGVLLLVISLNVVSDLCSIKTLKFLQLNLPV